MDFQVELIFVLIEVTALNAEWLVSNNFLPALRYCPSASNGWAASARWSADRDFRVPSQVKLTRTAAIPSRRFWAGDWEALAGLLGASRRAGIGVSRLFLS